MARKVKVAEYSKYDKKKKRRTKFQWTPVSVLFGMVGAFGLGVCWSQWNSSHRDVQQAIEYSSLISSLNAGEGSPTKRIPTDIKNVKFLVFHRLMEAQGQGNHMHGLLAAHLLADEFERVVCVSDHYKDFHMAFEPVDPMAVEHCATILARHNKEPPETKWDHTIELLNYRSIPPNECMLKELLSSPAKVLHITANTYPRWPGVPPHINFFAFYKAKPILLDILPYPHNQPPPVVVHLRHADNDGGDFRKGVDDKSLRALGKLVPVDTSQHSPFLVTNNVKWGDFFQENFSWSHSYWKIVMHSALGYQWEGRDEEEQQPKLFGGNANEVALQKKYQSMRREMGVDNWEIMQLWADWYTLLRAQKVYHTFSDFSLSAVHWMNTWSRTYDGLDPATGKLILLEENWISDGVTPRLVDRTPDILKNCDQERRGY